MNAVVINAISLFKLAIRSSLRLKDRTTSLESNSVKMVTEEQVLGRIVAKHVLDMVVDEPLEINTATGVSTAGTQVNTSNIDNLSDMLFVHSWLVNQVVLNFQPSSPQLVNEDFKQIHPNDLEEIDLRWQMAMLTMRARRKCRALRSQDTKHKESTKRTMPMKTHASTTLVSCDGLGGYDWSDQAEEAPNYALMAYTSRRNFMPLKPDLSYMGLDEFADKPVVENCNAKTSESKSKDVRKNIDSLIIEEWVSDDEEEVT
nr:hypothetical protein [Tanacetum cinerariifolium]